MEALLTGTLAKDLRDVGIEVCDVRRALASTTATATATAAATANAGAAAAPKLVDAVDSRADGAHAEGGGAVVIRLHYSHEAAHQGYRRLLDGPGYAPEGDAVAGWMSTALTASTMVATVWWLTGVQGAEGEDGGGPAVVPLVLAALVAGPAGVLLGTGRGKQVLQALYVTLLAGAVCTLLYLVGGQLASWLILAIVRGLTLAAHALGLALGAFSEGGRLLRGVVARKGVGDVTVLPSRVAPWLEGCLRFVPACLRRGGVDAFGRGGSSSHGQPTHSSILG